MHRSLALRICPLLCQSSSGATQSRHNMHTIWERPYLRDLWARRHLAGEDLPTPRHRETNWHLPGELSAFAHRISEEGLLVDAEGHATEKLFELFTSHPPRTLVAAGQETVRSYCDTFLQSRLPALPLEAREAIVAFLTDQSRLVDVTKQLGMTELVVHVEKMPVPSDVLTDTFYALVGLLSSFDEQRANKFVQDSLLTQLLSVDPFEIFTLHDPASVLCDAVGDPAPEWRLLRQAGRNTVLPVYIVGVYHNKVLIGESAGESVTIAEEMATLDALRRMWNMQLESLNLNFDADVVTAIDSSQQINNANVSMAADDAAEDPLDVKEMTAMFQQRFRPAIGKPYRRRLKHKFYGGAKHKTTIGRYMRTKIYPL